MHEFSIATGIVENVLTFAEEHPQATVLKVRVQVGELACVDAEQLRFCYSSITTTTRLDGSELEVETGPAQVHCPKCDYKGAPKYWDSTLASGFVPTLQCPWCSGIATATEGHECRILSVQVRQNRLTDQTPLEQAERQLHSHE